MAERKVSRVAPTMAPQVVFRSAESCLERVPEGAKADGQRREPTGRDRRSAGRAVGVS